MLTGTSKVTLDIPHDRAGTFDPKLIAQALCTVYRAETAEADLAALDAFEAGAQGQAAPGHRPAPAAPLGPGHPVLRVPAFPREPKT